MENNFLNQVKQAIEKKLDKDFSLELWRIVDHNKSRINEIYKKMYISLLNYISDELKRDYTYFIVVEYPILIVKKGKLFIPDQNSFRRFALFFKLKDNLSAIKFAHSRMKKEVVEKANRVIERYARGYISPDKLTPWYKFADEILYPFYKSLANFLTALTREGITLEKFFKETKWLQTLSKKFKEEIKSYLNLFLSLNNILVNALVTAEKETEFLEKLNNIQKISKGILVDVVVYIKKLNGIRYPRVEIYHENKIIRSHDIV